MFVGWGLHPHVVHYDVDANIPATDARTHYESPSCCTYIYNSCMCALLVGHCFGPSLTTADVSA